MHELIKLEKMSNKYIAISPNIIVRVSKESLVKNREGEEIYHHQSFVWYTRNLQCGEIVSISDIAKKQLPLAEIGDLLIYHHFIESSASLSETKSHYLVDETETDFYFNVLAKEVAGEFIQTYGILKDNEIIPHPFYTFLHQEEICLNEDSLAAYRLSRDEKIRKLNQAKQDNLYKMHNSPANWDLRTEIRRKEKESLETTKELSKRKTIAFKVAYVTNEKLYKKEDIISIPSYASNTIVSVNGNDYRVVESKYISSVIPEVAPSLI